MEGITAAVKKNLTIPNLLSFMRIVIIVPFVISIMHDDYARAGAVLIVSGLSDMFDGLIARMMNQGTKLGEMLDPVADKLTLVSVMICVGIKFSEVIPLVTILVFKEISMLMASAVLIKKHKFPPSAKWYGKLATVLFYVSVIIIVSLKAIWNIENKFLTVALMSLTAAFMLYAVIKYLKIFIPMIKSDK